MKKAILGAFVLMMLVSFSGVAMAVPAWWDTYDFKAALEGTVENTGEAGEAAGSVTATVPNNADPNKYKEVFVEFDWYREDDPDNSASFDVDVLMSWDGHPDKASLNLVDSGLLGGTGFWFDYDYTIVPQPANETFYFAFSGLDVGDILRYDYDIRTKCFDDDTVPEPAGLGVVGLALLALRRRRS